MKENKIEIIHISPEELKSYQDFILKAKYKSYAQFREISEEDITKLFFYEVSELKKKEPYFILLAKIGEEVIGLLSFHYLSWDSKHFGMKMGRIKHILGNINPEMDLKAKESLIQSALREFKEMNIKHITCRIPVDDFNTVYVLEQAGFYLADTIIEYYFDFRKQEIPQISHQCELRLYQDSDYEMVKNGSKEIFKEYIGRFHRDPYLDPKKCDELYEQWMLNSCRGLADDCIVALIDQEFAGFISCEIFYEINKILPLSFGEMVLIGVSPKFRRRKVCTSMVNFGQHYFKDKVNLVRVATQINNFYVQRAWHNLGFLPKYAFHTFHFFIE